MRLLIHIDISDPRTDFTDFRITFRSPFETSTHYRIRLNSHELRTFHTRAGAWCPYRVTHTSPGKNRTSDLCGTSPLVSIASCELLSVSTSLLQDTPSLQRCPHGPAPRTHIAWFHSETLSLALLPELDGSQLLCLDCTQFHSRSLDNVALRESQIFQQSKNMLLIPLNFHQLVIDHSDRTVQPTLRVSRFDLLLPQSQNHLHGRTHSQALICTTLAYTELKAIAAEAFAQQFLPRIARILRPVHRLVEFGYESKRM